MAKFFWRRKYIIHQTIFIVQFYKCICNCKLRLHNAVGLVKSFLFYNLYSDIIECLAVPILHHHPPHPHPHHPHPHHLQLHLQGPVTEDATTITIITTMTTVIVSPIFSPTIYWQDPDIIIEKTS